MITNIVFIFSIFFSGVALMLNAGQHFVLALITLGLATILLLSGFLIKAIEQYGK